MRTGILLIILFFALPFMPLIMLFLVKLAYTISIVKFTVTDKYGFTHVGRKSDPMRFILGYMLVSLMFALCLYVVVEVVYRVVQKKEEEKEED